MPELPEVKALVDFLTERAVGEAVTGVELGSITVLKTFNPPPEALIGAPVTGSVAAIRRDAERETSAENGR